MRLQGSDRVRAAQNSSSPPAADLRMARQDLLDQGGSRTGHPDDKDRSGVLDSAIRLAIEMAGPRRDHPVEAPDDSLAVEAAAQRPNAVSRLEVSHRCFVVAHIVVHLPQREVEVLAITDC
jgi:hypothetical protein